MAAPNAFLLSLARKLLETYKADPSIVANLAGLLLPDKELAAGLGKLITDGLLNIGSAGTGNISLATIASVINTITALQKTARLVPDGVFGRRFQTWLNTRPFLERPRGTSLGTSTTSVSPDGGHAFRYYVSDEEFLKLRGLTPGQAMTLFRLAWENWMSVCDIEAKQGASQSESNVVVNVKILDQGPNVLAIGTDGPPGNQQLELSFEQSQTWDHDTFLYAATHEIGHNLGIGHLGDPAAGPQIMNDTLNTGITKPQTLDIQEAQRIWGAP